MLHFQGKSTKIERKATNQKVSEKNPDFKKAKILWALAQKARLCGWEKERYGVGVRQKYARFYRQCNGYTWTLVKYKQYQN